ncbi:MULTISPECIES: chemotaxis protein CheC [Halorussus]|uniref:chemotaxis protein CheC n=1 Tax=Halorussus TaxID=1070314 RepID=UPI0020A0D529|nr:chemotaxis protein CheC [Halorussus vallis]USZ76583.1 chemotaxis protein CheC [Halorussus vallis]
MNVNIESLGTFNRTAQEGAERAAANLTGMTGIETAVDVTKVSLACNDPLVAEGDRAFGGDRAGRDAERVGVAIDFEDGISGGSLLSFSHDSVETLLEALLAGAEFSESAICEVGNVVTSGFIDAWADRLETTVDISPPEYVEGSPEELADAAGFDPDRALVFESRVGAVGEELDVAFHMFPEAESMETILADGDAVPVEKLRTLREMARSGAATASESVTMMTGIETEVEVTTLDFVPVENVPRQLSDRQCVGVVLAFEETLGGYILILFDEPSAREVVAALVPGTDEVCSFEGVERSAMQEIGNVMTSSFVDGWANVLDTTIDISPPQFVHDMGSAVADSVVARLGQRQEFAFLFDATLRAADREFDCGVYALPEQGELSSLLGDLEAGATAERKTNAGRLEP